MKSGAQIQYFSGIYTDRALKNVLTQVQNDKLEECLRSTNQVRFEKLQGYKNVYSIEYSKAGRLLLTIQDGILVVLADLPTHNYKTTLKNLKSGVLKLFEEENNNLLAKPDDDDDKENEFEPQSEAPVYLKSTYQGQNDDGDIGKVEYQPVVFEGNAKNPKVLVLDQEQQEAIEIDLPAIISGAPGSGKTTVAKTLLGLVGRIGKDEKILYVTRSKDLVEHLEKELKNTATDEMRSQIEIKTYNDFLINPNNNAEKAILEPNAALAHVKKWLRDYIQKDKNKNTYSAAFKDDIDNLYQEFRIRSGHNEQNYCNEQIVGAKQSLYKTAKERGWVNQAYKAFIADLSRETFRIADFTDIPPVSQKYHTVLVDEAQDFSHQQIASIKNSLAKTNRVCFFYGDGQSLEDDIPSKIYIKSLFPAPLVCQTASLSQYYRCPEAVMSVAEVVNDLRKKRTPNTKKEEPIKSSPSAKNKTGGVRWITRSKTGNELKELQDLVAHNPQLCIIAPQDKHDEIRKLLKPQEWQLRTPERAKGLQYPTVIVYEPFFGEKFAAIDAAMVDGIEDPSFSSPLSQLFVSITRSEEDVIFFSSIHRQNLENLLRVAIDATKTTVQITAKTFTAKDYEERVVSLMRAKEFKDARTILTEELKYNQTQIDAFCKDYDVSFPIEESPLSTSRTTSSTSSKKKSPPKKPTQKAKGAPKKQAKAAQVNAVVKSESETVEKPTDYQGCTMLYRAASENNLAALEMLLDNNEIDVDERQGEGPHKGSTALDAAVYHGHVDIIEFLVMHGASLKKLKSRMKNADGGISYLTMLCNENCAYLLSEFDRCEYTAILLIKSELSKWSLKFKTAEVQVKYVSDELTKLFDDKAGLPMRRASELFTRVRWALYAGEKTEDILAAIQFAIDDLCEEYTLQENEKNQPVLSGDITLSKGDYMIISNEIMKGRSKALTKAYEAGVHLAPYTRLLMVVAINAENKDALSVLLENGATVDEQKEGISALYLAAGAGFLDGVDLLLQHKADVDLVQGEGAAKGERALDIACQHGHYIIAERLLSVGAKVDASTPAPNEQFKKLINRTIACQKIAENVINNEINKFGEVQRNYFKKDVNSAKRKELNASVRWLLVGGNKSDTVTKYIQNMLLRMLSPSLQALSDPLYGTTPLYRAAKTSDLPTLRRLIAERVNLDELQLQGKYEGETALVAAVVSGNKEAVEALLEAGAKVNQLQAEPSSFYGLTAFYAAIREEKLDIIALLLKFGADIDESPTVGELIGVTPLLTAALRGNVKLVDALLKMGADTALLFYRTLIDGVVHYENGYSPEIIKLFKQSDRCNSAQALQLTAVIAGANIDDEDKTYLKQPDVRSRILKKARGVLLTSSSETSEQYLKDAIRLELSEKSIKEGTANQRELKLLEACRHGQLDIVERLVAQGVSVNPPPALSKDSYPIAEAAHRGFPGIVRTLIDAGAEIEGIIGTYALLLAVQGYTWCVEKDKNPQTYSDVINTLIAAGATTRNLRIQSEGTFHYDKSMKEGVREIFEQFDRCELAAQQSIHRYTKTLPEADKTRLAGKHGQALLKLQYKITQFHFVRLNETWVQKEIEETVNAILASQSSSFLDFKNRIEARLSKAPSSSTLATSEVQSQKASVDDEFFEACLQGNEPLVNRLLLEGANANYMKKSSKDDKPTSAIYNPAGKGYVSVVNALIAAGADLQSSAGGHVLLAAIKGYVTCEKANIDTKSHSQVIETLIANGANTHQLRTSSSNKISYDKLRYSQKEIAWFVKVDRAEQSAIKHIDQSISKLSASEKLLLKEQDSMFKKLIYKVTGLFFVDQQLPVIKKFIADQISDIVAPIQAAPALLPQYTMATSSQSSQSVSSRAQVTSQRRVPTQAK